MVVVVSLTLAASLSAAQRAEDYPLGDIPLDPETYARHVVVLPAPMLDGVPASYDARTQGWVTPAKDQGGCGSCWAFASVGAMESHLLRKYGIGPENLSEQQLLSCDSGSCDGGSSTAIQFWESRGPVPESCFPYTASDTTACSYSCNEMVYRVVGWHTVSATTEQFKASLYDEGPSYWRYTVYSDFFDYWNAGAPGEVYRNTGGSLQGGHAVLIIGWDDFKGAFLCKNSWGQNEGPNGDGTFWIAYGGHANDLGFGMVNFDLNSGAVPPNDNWANAISLETPPTATTGNNLGATTEPDEQQLNPAGATVWWFVRAPISGTLTIDTIGSDFDTMLHIYTGYENGFANLIPVANNDDAVGLQSRVTFSVNAGQYYEIRVAGYNGAQGSIQLNVGGVVTPVPASGLALWLKADAGVSGTAVTQWSDQSGNNRHATQATGASQPALVSGVLNGLPVVRFDGANDFLTFNLPVNGLGGMTIFLVAANTQNQTVGSSQAERAALFWNETAAWGAVYLSPFQGSVASRFGTTQTGNRMIYTRPASVGSAFTLTTSMKNGATDSLFINGALVASEGGELTTIAGCRDTGNVGRGYNDDTFYAGDIAEVLVYDRALTAAERQLVEQYLGARWFPPVLPNDDCSGAITLTAGVPQTMNTATATSFGDPAPSCSWFGKGVWYQFAPASSGPVVVDTCGSDFDTVFEVFTGSCGALTPVAWTCRDDNGPFCQTTRASVAFNATASTTYYILAGGWTGESGKLQIMANRVPATTLTVNSLNPSSGVSISVPLLDLDGQANGTTSFTRSYAQNSIVVLSAPPALGPITFVKWQQNGVDFGFTTNATVTMGGNHTMTAVYQGVVTLSGRITAPGGTGLAGVTISFSDGGGLAITDGNGDYSREVPYGWSGTATPGLNCHIFDPPSRTYSPVTANQTGQNYTGDYSAPGVATLFVSNLSDSGPGSLRQAIQDANAGCGTEIVFSGLTGTITLTNGELVISNGISIVGPGPAVLAISGNGASRIFNVQSNAADAAVTISELTIREGGGNLGGAIFNQGRLSLSNCVVTNNFAKSVGSGYSSISGAGGGIYNGGVMTLDLCVISGNRCDQGYKYSYYAVWQGGSGGGVYNTNWMRISRSSLNANRCGDGGQFLEMGAPLGGDGGGAYNTGTLIIEDSTIRGNACGTGGNNGHSGAMGGSGGGIWNGGMMSVTACTISDNLAGNGSESGPMSNERPGGMGGSGGGVYNSGAMALTNCTFAGNRCGDGGKGAEIQYSPWIGVGGAGGNGGGVCNNGTGVMANCTLAANLCGDGGDGGNTRYPPFSGGDGGAGGSGGALWNQGTLTVCQSTLSANATGQGGAGGLGYPGDPNFPSTPDGSPGADGSGGGVSLAGGTAQLVNTLVASNSASGGGPDVSGAVVSLGFNLVGDAAGSSGLSAVTGDLLNVNPLLGPLADNGGPTYTCALLPASPAINAGTNSAAPAFDQRGVPRPQGHSFDIGAYEYCHSGNAVPTISSIPDPSTTEDTPTAVLEFTVGDFETIASGLVVSAGASSPSLIPIENIVFGGVGAHRTLALIPAAEQFGTSTIAITATDADGGTATETFLLTVEPINDPPTLTPMADGVVYQNGGIQIFTLHGITAGPANESGQALTVSATSSNPALIPDPVVSYTSPESTGTLSFAPAPGAIGSSLITVTVQDNGGTASGGQDTLTRSFEVTVLPKLRFLAGSASGGRFSQVVVPVRVTGFTNINSFQFSLHWDPLIADFIGVEEFGLPDLSLGNFGTTGTNGGTLTVAWEDSNTACKSMSDNATLFAVRFLLRGNPGATGSVTMDGIPTTVEAANCAFSLVPVETVPGQLSIPPTVTLAGAVSYGDTALVVPGVAVNLTGPVNLSTFSTGDGSYALNELPTGGDYLVQPSKDQDTPSSRGVTTLDITMVRRHILGIAALDSGYKVLAGDVNGSRSVSTLDITMMRRVILGITNAFPAGLWRFVPSSHVFTNAQAPWDAPTNCSYTNLQTNLTAENFRAIKLGDVNNTWTTPADGVGLMAAAASDLVVTASRQVAQAGDTVIARITAEGFRRVSSVQFTLEWDPAVLRYGGVEPGLSGLSDGNFGTGSTAAGKLAFSWDDPAGAGVTIEDGTALFTVNFTVVGKAGCISPLALTDSMTPREAGVDFAAAGLRTENGLVSVVERPLLSVNPDYRQGTFRLSVPTVAGMRYVLEYSDTLPGTDWTALPAVTGDGTVRELVDPGAPQHQRFYRVRVE